MDLNTYFAILVVALLVYFAFISWNMTRSNHNNGDKRYAEGFAAGQVSGLAQATQMLRDGLPEMFTTTTDAREN